MGKLLLGLLGSEDVVLLGELLSILLLAKLLHFLEEGLLVVWEFFVIHKL